MHQKAALSGAHRAIHPVEHDRFVWMATERTWGAWLSRAMAVAVVRRISASPQGVNRMESSRMPRLRLRPSRRTAPAPRRRAPGSRGCPGAWRTGSTGNCSCSSPAVRDRGFARWFYRHGKASIRARIAARLQPRADGVRALQPCLGQAEEVIGRRRRARRAPARPARAGSRKPIRRTARRSATATALRPEAAT